MQSRGSKYLRRQARTLRRSLGKLGTRSVGHTRNYLFGRTANLRIVQRRVALWTVLVFVLIGAAAIQIVANRDAFTKLAAAPGGTYIEGTIGPIATLNPILASSSAELSATRLLFTGLFDYDRTGSLRPRLATSIDTKDGKTYTIHLRQGVKWSDGQPFTSADVVYTLGLIQNDDVRSPLEANFRGVAVSSSDPWTVRLALPSAYAPFADSLTFGIVPKHVLGSVSPGNIRANRFNRNPVTLGAFEFSSFREKDADGSPALYLSANPSYFGGAPSLDRFQLHVYKDQTSLLSAYRTREVGAVAGATEVTALSAVANRTRTAVTNVPIDDGVYALFNTKSDLYSDSNLRAAIRQGTDLQVLRKLIGGGVGQLDGPVLASEVPAVGDLKQQTGDATGAKAALDTLGWKVGKSGIRSKDGQPLVLRIAAIDSGDYPKIAQELARQWQILGIDVQVNGAPSDTAGQQVLIPRAYDVLVYELAIGADPDVYAYWHSSQAGVGGLNFANYSSSIADDNLTSARAVLDTQLRDAKYTAFAKQWLADTPAIALFQQDYHYVSGDDIAAVPAASTLVSSTDRYADVGDWTVGTSRLLTTP
jgi:peptide/nickel transport system substrate-binding protein